MNFLGNMIWLLFGGFLTALGYIFGGIILCATIVGIPFGVQCFKLAGAVLFPFGKRVVHRSANHHSTSIYANIIWIISGGLYTALNHLFWAIFLTLTIVGIPFARQHLKLFEISLMPFGKRIIQE